MENKRKHLELIQGVINRMARCSFLIKGWCITIVTALIVLSTKENDFNVLRVSIFPIVVFWALDGYFLYQERLYRELYNQVRKLKEEQIDFSMNATVFKGDKKTWTGATFSLTLLLLYISLILLVFISISVLQAL
ncbi:MAG: hypothetical protein K9N00_06395 [Candidatus Marinimicrobia bacterium]|nr:hypothetical protein [Candidatus Neomarinimicrobiota bacterium]